ncbi:hypothetical protein [Endozoicomonas sp. ALD040]|uniref:hypothetical protein n=1 Tax=Endozoicomonas sp. ALD040 TaxID=3403079 RepID=UPI003BAFB4B1
MYKKIIPTVVLTIFTITAYAEDTSYAKLREIKAWTTKIDLYYENNQEHQCTGGLKTRYLIKPDKSNHISLVYTAYAAGHIVSLSYNCGDDGFPWVEGVRVKQ